MVHLLKVGRNGEHFLCQCRNRDEAHRRIFSQYKQEIKDWDVDDDTKQAALKELAPHVRRKDANAAHTMMCIFSAYHSIGGVSKFFILPAELGNYRNRVRFSIT